MNEVEQAIVEEIVGNKHWSKIARFKMQEKWTSGEASDMAVMYWLLDAWQDNADVLRAKGTRLDALFVSVMWATLRQVDFKSVAAELERRLNG